jgi:hypothetical protein
MRNHTMSRTRWMRGAALGFALITFAGCDDFMKVTNPGAVDGEALNNPDYINLMVNGVRADFQPAFAWTALWSGVFTDELRNHHGYFENGEIDRREVGETNGTYQLSVYNGLHRARFLADSVTSRLRTIYADSANAQLNVGTTLAYAGYSWTLLGEQYCSTPINRSAPVPSAELLRTAVSRFEDAITVTTAARGAASNITNAGQQAARIAQADAIINLARVGAARAALGVSSDAAYRDKALAHARAVTPAYTSESDEGFSFSATYTTDADRYTRRVSSPFYEFIRRGRWFSISDTPFEGLNDPRVPHADTLYRAADGTSRTFANSPTAFGANDGTVSGIPFQDAETIRIGSALEARYIIAELEGVSAANIEFVNERRMIGGQVPLPATATAEEYMAALREQRARDLYLDSHRMGDIRRYKEMYGVDLWPTGAYFGSTTQTYGTQECWPIPVSESY